MSAAAILDQSVAQGGAPPNVYPAVPISANGSRIAMTRSAHPLQDLEQVGVLVALVGADQLLVHDPPPAPLHRRKADVALDLRSDPGQVDPVRAVECGPVHLRTADDEHLVIAGGGAQGLLERPGQQDPIRQVEVAARQDDAGPPGQRPADRLPGPPAHDDVVAHGQPLEPLQVGGQAPRQATLTADDAVLGDRDDEGHSHADVDDRHTAIGALMWGCGSYPSRRKWRYSKASISFTEESRTMRGSGRGSRVSWRRA